MLGVVVFVGAPVRSIADFEPAAMTSAQMPTSASRAADRPIAVMPAWLRGPVTTEPLLAAIDFVMPVPAQLRFALSAWPAPAPPLMAAHDTLIKIDLTPAIDRPAWPPTPQLATPPINRVTDDVAPFGLTTRRAPQGLLWVKWRQVEASIDAGRSALARCAKNLRYCSSGAARFAAIVKQARHRQGRNRIEWINRRVNRTIRYRSDKAQWRRIDVWSAPFAANRQGSFETGFGDCEDYAIAKYVALRGAGTAANDLRLLIVRDTSARIDHAVLAVRDNGQWLVLDNRWSRLIEENQASFFTPLFALDAGGVQRYTTAVAAGTKAKAGKPVRESNADTDGARIRPSKISG